VIVSFPGKNDRRSNSRLFFIGAPGEDATLREGEDATLREGEDATLREGEDATLREGEDATLREGRAGCLPEYRHRQEYPPGDRNPLRARRQRPRLDLQPD
jgi:hypothetical protein